MEKTPKTKAPKTYTIELTYSNKDRVSHFTGTIDELRDSFSYTLEIGHSWNPRIPKDGGKTIKSLVNNIQKSYEEKEAACYSRTWVNLVPNR